MTSPLTLALNRLCKVVCSLLVFVDMTETRSSKACTPGVRSVHGRLLLYLPIDLFGLSGGLISRIRFRWSRTAVLLGRPTSILFETFPNVRRCGSPTRLSTKHAYDQ